MIVFASTLRITRRSRRTPSVASLVRALGTVRISEQPSDDSSSAPAVAGPTQGSTVPLHILRRQTGPSRSS